MLSTLTLSSRILEVALFSVILGVGSGMMFPIFNVAVQNAVSRRDIGVGTASMQFFRNIGATVALPIFGVIMNLTANADIESSTNISAEIMNLAIHNVFLAGIIISIMGLVTCIFLKDAILSNYMENQGANNKMNPADKIENGKIDVEMDIQEKAK